MKIAYQFKGMKMEKVIQNKPNSSCAPNCIWDSSKDFLDKFKEGISYDKIKELRRKEFLNTIELVNNGFYLTENGKKVAIKETGKMVSETKFYSHKFEVKDIPTIIGETKIDVINSDCLEEGIKLLDAGYNPAILNMANRQNPGGGVRNGAGAQEETIFRRTNIFRSLYQFTAYAEQYGIHKSPYQYPMDRNFGGIYTPIVTIFREDEKRGYKLMEKPREIAIISVAGINKPQLNANGLIEDFLIEPIKNKIRTIFRIGLKHGHDSLVLGALGCGAFCNPPRHIAKLFKEVLNEKEFINKYRYIVFAILEDHNSYRNHNTEGNYLPFKQEFP